MSDRIYINYRNPNSFSHRSLLAKASIDDMQDMLEKDMLLKYQDTLQQLNQKQKELDNTHELLRNIYTGDGESYLSDIQKSLQESASYLSASIESLDRKLIELQQDAVLRKVLEREKAKAYENEKKKGEEAHERAKEKAEQAERDLIARYQESRQKHLQEKERAKQQQESEETEAPVKNNEGKFMNIISSQRFAAAISLILCIVLYLSFLSTFSAKRDTYICYTTKTGTHYHSPTCIYLDTAYETTVYEVSRKYKPCKYCNPCVEQYETTITVRNYVAPALISVPTSVAVFFLLTYKKKK